LWEYRRELPKIEGGYHNDLFDRARGTIALYDDKVLLATADAHIVALDAHTGKVVWDTTVADYRQGYTFTSPPLAAHGKIVAGIRWAASRVISKKAAPTAPRNRCAWFPDCRAVARVSTARLGSGETQRF
jgi:hypothetical protein